MKPKSEQEYQKLGFRYKNDQEFQREFALAKAYFELFPQATKIGRKAWSEADWPEVLKILHTSRPDLVPDLTLALSSPPKHSYINQVSAENPAEKLILALGSKIAKGHFGKVKHTMDEHGNHDATKIEITNNPRQSKETEINRDQGLLLGEKMSRKGGRNQEEDKFYTSFPFLGVDLCDRFDRYELTIFTKVLGIARKTAWNLHRIHSGDNKSKTPYAHGDIKPDNVMLADNGHVEIVDFGFTKKLDEQIELIGTPKYLPTDNPDRIKDPRVAKITLRNMQTLGLIGTDIAAFKKLFAMILHMGQLFSLLYPNIQIIFGDSVYELLARKNFDTMLSITMALIEQEIRLMPGTLSHLPINKQQLIGYIFAQIDMLEEISYGCQDHTEMRIVAYSLRHKTVSLSQNDTALTECLEYAKDVVKQYQAMKEAREAVAQTSSSSMKEARETVAQTSSSSSLSAGIRKITLFGEDSVSLDAEDEGQPKVDSSNSGGIS